MQKAHKCDCAVGRRLLTRRSEVVLKKAEFPSRNSVGATQKILRLASSLLVVFFTSSPCKLFHLPPKNTPSPKRRFALNATAHSHTQKGESSPSGSLKLSSLVLMTGGQIPRCSRPTKTPNLSPPWKETEAVFLLGWPSRLMHLAAWTILGRGQPRRALVKKETMLLK